VQFHAVVLAAFASIIAPFGGFFASGFKRGFKIKDFGDSIPGHGGMTDRMDCQVSPQLQYTLHSTQGSLANCCSSCAVLLKLCCSSCAPPPLVPKQLCVICGLA